MPAPGEGQPHAHLSSRVLRLVWARHSSEGPVGPLHVGGQLVRGGRGGGLGDEALVSCAGTAVEAAATAHLAHSCSHRQPPPPMGQGTHSAGTASAPGGRGAPRPDLSQWLDHPRFCLQRVRAGAGSQRFREG